MVVSEDTEAGLPGRRSPFTCGPSHRLCFFPEQFFSFLIVNICITGFGGGWLVTHQSYLINSHFSSPPGPSFTTRLPHRPPLSARSPRVFPGLEMLLLLVSSAFVLSCLPFSVHRTVGQFVGGRCVSREDIKDQCSPALTVCAAVL